MKGVDGRNPILAAGAARDAGDDGIGRHIAYDNGSGADQAPAPMRTPCRTVAPAPTSAPFADPYPAGHAGAGRECTWSPTVQSCSTMAPVLMKTLSPSVAPALTIAPARIDTPAPRIADGETIAERCSADREEPGVHALFEEPALQ